MNYYERIQQSINYIEDNLDQKIDLMDVAKKAQMSVSVFYRMFFSIVGFTVKEYIRNRRFSFAAVELKRTNQRIIEIAIACDYDSADAFSRSFYAATGFLPSEFRKINGDYLFERIDIMTKYFGIQDNELLERYPDIKVLKKVEPMNVAYYNFYGKQPEQEAFSVMMAWVKSQKMILADNYRILGYNNPSPESPEQEEYGYEVCVTIGNQEILQDEKVKTKRLSGGLYATCHIKQQHPDVELGDDIMKAWERVVSWVKDSKYEFGEHQWFEEHLSFDEAANSFSEVALYIPLKRSES